MKSPLLRLAARMATEHDRDTARFLDWWHTSTPEEKLRIWDRIQQIYEDQEIELMSRLAQWAMTEISLRERTSK